MFRVKNNREIKRYVTLNICNLKRNLTMFADGGRVYSRQLSEIYSPLSEWGQCGTSYQFRLNNGQKFSNARVYKLTFEIALEPHSVT